MKKGHTYNVHMKAAILIAAFFMACSPQYSHEEVVDLTREQDSLSVEVAHDVDIIYTDSSVLRAKISAPLMKRKPDAEEPYVEMPNGVTAYFYGSNGQRQSSMHAQYAINYERKDVIELRDSVRVINVNDEEFKTDHLIWDKKKRTVVSERPVRVRIRDEKIIMAEGFESDERFMRYTFKKVTGIVYLNEEEPKDDEN